MVITIKELEKLGFKDQTDGWGGAQGSDYVYKHNKLNITIRTVDFDYYWHLDSDFKVVFKTINSLNNYCIEKFGASL